MAYRIEVETPTGPRSLESAWEWETQYDQWEEAYQQTSKACAYLGYWGANADGHTGAAPEEAWLGWFAPVFTIRSVT